MLNATNAFLRCALLSVSALAISAPLGACGAASTTPASGKAKELTPREVMQRYKPAIVRIESRAGSRVGVGTGFFVSAEGRIATNLHVIIGGNAIRVKLSDDTMHEVKRVVAIDHKRDLAIIEIDVGRKMPTVKIGDSDIVQPGDAVIAVGNPMRLDYTVSDGLISSVRPSDDDDNIMLQISAPISQGSSGGPLFNAFGEVIGVARAVSAQGQNLNFGVPVNYLKPMMAHEGGESIEEFAARFAPKQRPGVIKTDAGVIERDVPNHDVALLKDCSREEVLKVFSGIQRAIELGAPLYNDGNHEACFSIYEQTAAHFEKEPKLCKGLRDALGVGLLKAETQGDPTRKAWAMRDAFDGLLRVIVTLAEQSQ